MKIFSALEKRLKIDDINEQELKRSIQVSASTNNLKAHLENRITFNNEIVQSRKTNLAQRSSVDI